MIKQIPPNVVTILAGGMYNVFSPCSFTTMDGQQLSTHPSPLADSDTSEAFSVLVAATVAVLLKVSGVDSSVAVESVGVETTVSSSAQEAHPTSSHCSASVIDSVTTGVASRVLGAGLGACSVTGSVGVDV